MTRKKELYNPAEHLTVSTEVRVRFNENDPLGIVWHGNYIKYFEDGREAFGREHNIGYLEIFDLGFSTPIVESSCKHKLSLKYGDVAKVVTEFICTPAAKMIFAIRFLLPQETFLARVKLFRFFLTKQENYNLRNQNSTAIGLPKTFQDEKCFYKCHQLRHTIGT